MYNYPLLYGNNVGKYSLYCPLVLTEDVNFFAISFIVEKVEHVR